MRNGLEKSSSLTETTGGPLASLHDAKKKKNVVLLLSQSKTRFKILVSPFETVNKTDQLLKSRLTHQDNAAGDRITPTCTLLTTLNRDRDSLYML